MFAKTVSLFSIVISWLHTEAKKYVIFENNSYYLGEHVC